MRTLITLFGIGGAMYAAIAVYIWLFQSRFVYFPNQPTRLLEATPADVGLDYQDVSFKARDGTALHGWFIPASGTAAILYFHGNAGNISHRLDTVSLFHTLDLDVFIIDYRGYGRSDGTPHEQGTYDDAHGAWEYLTGERGFRADRIIVFGRSLGGAIAGWLASEVTPAGVILESTFSSIPDMARAAFPWLPSGLTRIRYDTESRLIAINCPLLLLHSRNDEMIPYQLGEKLRDSAPPGTTFVTLEGGHNDAHVVSGATYTDALREFIDRVVPASD